MSVLTGLPTQRVHEEVRMQPSSSPDTPDGTLSMPVQAQEIRTRVRRVVFMSKGPAIAGGGVYLCWTAGFGYLWTALPSIRPFIGAVYSIGLMGLLLVAIRMKRRLAQTDCQVQMQRKAT